VIENERQYQITRSAIRRFEQSLVETSQRSVAGDDVYSILRKAQEDAIRSQLDELQAELRAYELQRDEVQLSRPGVLRVE